MVSRNEFETALENLEKIRAYFSSHRLWHVPPETRDAAMRLHRNAHTIVGQLLGAGAPEDAPPPPREEAILERSFDPVKLERFARYLEQLSRWFAVVDRSAAGDLLGPLLAVASGLAGELDGIVERNGLGEAPERREVYEGSDRPTPDPAAAVPVPAVEPLVLDPGAGEPLLVEIGDGKHDLAPAVRERLGAFLAAAQLPMNESERRRFERDVCRWIEAIPPGQRLVINLSGLTGVVRPYPLYRPAETAD